MSIYRITFVIDLDQGALLDAEDRAERKHKAFPFWICGEKVCRVLRRQYGVKARLIQWEMVRPMAARGKDA